MTQYLACDTQWRRDSQGAPCGFDYAGVRAAAAMMGVEMDRETFEKLQVLETETLNIVREMTQD